jgi:hypothetical protein
MNVITDTMIKKTNSIVVGKYLKVVVQLSKRINVYLKHSKNLQIQKDKFSYSTLDFY